MGFTSLSLDGCALADKYAADHAHPWAFHSSEAEPETIQDTLNAAGIDGATTARVVEVVERSVNELAWARAGTALVRIVERLRDAGPVGGGLLRALGLLPGSLADVGKSMGISKQVLHYHDQKLRTALRDYAITAAGVRVDKGRLPPCRPTPKGTATGERGQHPPATIKKAPGAKACSRVARPSGKKHG